MGLQGVGRAELLVQWDLGEVDTRPATYQDQPSYRRSMLLRSRQLLLGFLFSPPDDRCEGSKELERLGVSAEFRCLFPDGLDLGPQD